MNTEKEKLEHIINILSALRDGKTIQYNYTQNFYVDITKMGGFNPTEFFNHPELYRVKPEPREWWLIVRKPNNDVMISFKKESEAKHHFVTHYTLEEQKVREIIHVREVVD